MQCYDPEILLSLLSTLLAKACVNFNLLTMRFSTIEIYYIYIHPKKTVTFQSADTHISVHSRLQ